MEGLSSSRSLIAGVRDFLRMVSREEGFQSLVSWVSSFSLETRRAGSGRLSFCKSLATEIFTIPLSKLV